MSKFTRTLTAGLMIALLALSLPVPALQAQSAGNVFGVQVQPFAARNASDVLTAVSTDVGIYVRYVGTNAAAATVAVDAATGDLTFIESGAASTTLECPISGALGGVIDVSNAACNTVGEVVDIINMSANWVAVPHAMLRSDSSDNTLITLSATDAKPVKGLGLLKDSAVALNMTAVMLPRDNDGSALGLLAYLGAPNATKLSGNPFADHDTVFTYGSGLMTTTNDVGNVLSVYCVVPKFVYGDSSTAAVAQSEQAYLLYTEAAAATTVTGTVSELTAAGGVTCNGGKLLFRMVGNTTLTVPTVVAAGFRMPRKF